MILRKLRSQVRSREVKCYQLKIDCKSNYFKRFFFVYLYFMSFNDKHVYFFHNEHVDSLEP